MTLFPLIEAPAEDGGQDASGVLPLYREAAWDLQMMCPSGGAGALSG